MQQRDIKKVTTEIPAALLETARQATGKSITETIRMGLEKLAHEQACRDVLSLHGSQSFEDMPLEALREDRELF